jgi:hypothetical protein
MAATTSSTRNATDSTAARSSWSLTLYDPAHFFVPNKIDRYSLGTKNRDLRVGEDGSLTIVVHAARAPTTTRISNWLPLRLWDLSRCSCVPTGRAMISSFVQTEVWTSGQES